MKEFGCAKRFVVAILILCGIANRVNGVSWSGPPYNLAIAHGQAGSITCKGNATVTPYWRSPTTAEGLANGISDPRPGFNTSESPPGDHHLHFTGNVSSTPTIISCSPSASGIERKVHVIVIKSPVFNKTITANANSITCSAEFRADDLWRPYFHYPLTTDTETRVGASDSEGVRTITATYCITEASKKTAEACSIIKFNNSPEDIEKKDKETATNMIRELQFPGNGANDPKRGAGDILSLGIALIFAGFVSILDP